MTRTDQTITLSGIKVLAGIWLIVAPFILGFTGAAAANSVILGILIGVFALVKVINPMGAIASSYANILLGLWLIISPFVLGFSSKGGELWNTMLLGIIVAVVATWSSSMAETHQQH